MEKSVIILMQAGAKKAGTKGMQWPLTVGSHRASMGRQIMARLDTRAIPQAMRTSRATSVAIRMPRPTKMRRYMSTIDILTSTSEAL